MSGCEGVFGMELSVLGLKGPERARRVGRLGYLIHLRRDRVWAKETGMHSGRGHGENFHYGITREMGDLSGDLDDVLSWEGVERSSARYLLARNA